MTYEMSCICVHEKLANRDQIFNANDIDIITKIPV